MSEQYMLRVYGTKKLDHARTKCIDSRACKWIHIHSYAGAKSKQQSRMGMYRKEYRYINNRPVFQQEGRKHYMWWTGRMWVIGLPQHLGSGIAALANSNCKNTTDFPDSKCSSGWEYIDKDTDKCQEGDRKCIEERLKKDTSITISCFNKRECPEELKIDMEKGTQVRINGNYHQVNTDESSILYKKIAEDSYLFKNANGSWTFSNKQEDIGSDTEGLAFNNECIEKCPNYCKSDSWKERPNTLKTSKHFEEGEPQAALIKNEISVIAGKFLLYNIL